MVTQLSTTRCAKWHVLAATLLLLAMAPTDVVAADEEGGQEDAPFELREVSHSIRATSSRAPTV